jgi:hypothetical protein
MTHPRDQPNEGYIQDAVVEQFRQRLLTAIQPMTDLQLLELAETIHDTLERRRALRAEYAHTEAVWVSRVDRSI